MPISTQRALPPEIADLQTSIEAKAKEYGLDVFETIFEMVDYEEMSMLAAYGGFPVRYPHWRFGAEYDEMMKSYSYGLSKIYEMVINTDPCYAYLLTANELADQKLVIAHVYGHCDFFKCNAWFSRTNRKMLDQMANHAARINRYVDRFGYEEVEKLVDACLSLEDLIDPHLPFSTPRGEPARKKKKPDGGGREETPPDRKFESKGYMDSFINPPEVLRREAERKKEAAREREESRSFPEHPQRDVLLFLLEHAPLKPWQHDILSIIRDEAYYYAPQGQTKIMNEGWACTVFNTPVFTDRGLIPMGEVVAGQKAGDAPAVGDGATVRGVYDSHVIRDRETITLRTRRGFEVTGSTNHRVLAADGKTWVRLDEFRVGDGLAVSGGGRLWATEPVEIDWQPSRRGRGVAGDGPRSGSDILTGVAGPPPAVCGAASGSPTPVLPSLGAARQASHAYRTPPCGPSPATLPVERPSTLPTACDERLATLLGYLVGDGHISRVEHHFGLTTGDAEAADRFAELVSELFDLTPTVRRDGSRLRVLVHSETVSDFLTDGLVLTSGPSAERKAVPDVVLRSPEPVVAAFLRACFDSDGYAGEQGVILSSKSERLSSQVQLLLLNFGILSRRRRQTDGCYHVHVAGGSAFVFEDRIGFGLPRKREALRRYVSDRCWTKREDWSDEVVSLTRGRADVYDISVEHTHRYAAAGLVNHNSYWHTTIMTQFALDPSEVVTYADHHSGTMATSPQRLNPYKLGIELFRDIEERWNRGQFGPEWEQCKSMAERENWDRDLGLGREKIFEVRRIHNDVTFIDTFLTPEFCAKHRMFSFAYNDITDYYEIASREFEKIKRQLLDGLTNHGRPVIRVIDGNHRNRGELLLKHEFTGTELRQDWARDTLSNLATLWGRPVNLETVVDEEPAVLSFDGTRFDVRPR